MSTRSVLLVEDEPLIRLVLAEALIDEGYHVSMASSVLEAVGVIGRNPAFDILITDVDMPGGLDGLDLAALVASHAPATAIVVTSGRTIDDGIRSDWSFIAKPFGISAVLDLVEESVLNHSNFANDWNTYTARAS